MTAPAPLSVVVPMHRPDPGLWEGCAAALLRLAADLDVEIVLALEPGTDDDAAVAASIEELGRRCRSVVVVRNGHQLGMVENWNRAVAGSTREWVMLIGQDDAVDAGGIERTLDTLGDPGTPRFLAHRRVLVRDGEPHAPHRSRFRRVVDRDAVFPCRRLDVAAEPAAYLALRNGNVIGEPCSVIFARTLFDDLGGYSAQFAHAADLDLALRAADHDGRIRVHPHAIAERHVHPSSLTTANLQDGSAARDRWALYERYAPTLPGRMHRRVRGAHAVFGFYDAAVALRGRAYRRCAGLTARSLALAVRSPGAAALRCWEIVRNVNDDRTFLDWTAS